MLPQPRDARRAVYTYKFVGDVKIRAIMPGGEEKINRYKNLIVVFLQLVGIIREIMRIRWLRSS